MSKEFKEVEVNNICYLKKELEVQSKMRWEYVAHWKLKDEHINREGIVVLLSREVKETARKEYALTRSQKRGLLLL